MRDKLKTKYYIEKFLNKENISENSKYFLYFFKKAKTCNLCILYFK